MTLHDRGAGRVVTVVTVDGGRGPVSAPQVLSIDGDVGVNGLTLNRRRGSGWVGAEGHQAVGVMPDGAVVMQVIVAVLGFQAELSVGHDRGGVFVLRSVVHFHVFRIFHGFSFPIKRQRIPNQQILIIKGEEKRMARKFGSNRQKLTSFNSNTFNILLFNLK